MCVSYSLKKKIGSSQGDKHQSKARVVQVGLGLHFSAKIVTGLEVEVRS